LPTVHTPGPINLLFCPTPVHPKKA
jgi:hypothetical protein